MTSNDNPNTDATPSEKPDSGRLPHWVFVVLPVVALVVGVVLGVVVTSLGRAGGGPVSAPSITGSPTSDQSADTAVVVPRECVQAAESVRQATTLIRENVAAIRDFRAQDIIDLLNRLETLDNQATKQAKACSDIQVKPTSPPASDSLSASP